MINPFTDVDECIRFVKDTKEEQMFMITSGSLGQTTVPIVHDLPQVSNIYIFCGNQARHEQWAKHWPKIKGVFTDIVPICKALKQAVFECDRNLISISFVTTNQGPTRPNLNHMDSLFMYTQIIKEILLTIDFEQQHLNDFITYCRDVFAENSKALQAVDKLVHEYHDHPPIWWYTHKNFLYSILNRSLRMIEVDLIISMGFFIRDLHNHIAKLHQEQYVGRTHLKSFIVYHSQGLSQTNFDQLNKRKNGLLSFNNFLSTSTDREVSFNFIHQTIRTSDLIGILFVIKIEPSIVSTPFANIRDVSYFKEEEFLFSMHSIFRIGRIQQIDNDRFWQVDLTLVSDNDPELHELTEQMHKDTNPNVKGWDRLGMWLIKQRDFNKAQDLYDILLDQTTMDREKTNIYNQLGLVKENQGEYQDAIAYYQQSNNILEKIFSPTDIRLATSYSNIGLVYDKMGDYSNALLFHEKALQIDQKNLPPNHPNLAASYNNIGMVYDNMGDYSNALSFHEKALQIYQKTLPSDHLDLATTYNNIGWVYRNIHDYSKALSSYERALEILERSLPPNHPDLQDVRKSINIVKMKM
ncbi:unnamed protein product [Rotaria sp. Silwood2]|nr:unnamed protein product [Rotaria sp. Silwood2]CAF3037186.1 unnamed protein product [Rotaria sp. Silwood2]CAF3891235.1 unnamed protein product [Rotaria sp. Silwood2]CAF4086520.1 unnamed protein product [Rotaria sp. Silwood2]